MLKKIVVVMLGLLLISSAAYAVGTQKDQTINAPKSALLGEYNGSTAMDESAVSDLQETVTAVYGIRFTPASSILAVVENASGEAITTETVLAIKNWSNDPADFDLTMTTVDYTLDPGTGETSVLQDWIDGLLEEPLNTESLGEDELYLASVLLTYPVGIVSGTTFNYELIASIDTKTPIVAAYTGYDAGDYGGDGTVTKTLEFGVGGTSVFTVIGYTSEVIASSDGMIGYDGAENAVVPGAKVVYTIVVENDTGSSSASGHDVTITHTVPTNTTFSSTSNVVTDSGDATFSANLSGGDVVWTQTGGIIDVGEITTFSYTVVID